MLLEKGIFKGYYISYTGYSKKNIYPNAQRNSNFIEFMI